MGFGLRSFAGIGALMALACQASKVQPGAADALAGSVIHEPPPSPGINPDAMSSMAPPPAPPTGGFCQCIEDSACVAEADALVAALKRPTTAADLNGRHYVGAECVSAEALQGRLWPLRPAVCLCYYAFGASNVRDFANALVLGNRDSCDVTGRSPECLYRSCEFPGCDPGDSTSCDVFCAEVDARLVADGARTFDAERRTSRCESCSCRSVYRVGAHCYIHPSAFARPYDCSLSDDAILAAEYPPASTTIPPAVPAQRDAGASCRD
jgi:hypothetical protein